MKYMYMKKKHIEVVVTLCVVIIKRDARVLLSKSYHLSDVRRAEASADRGVEYRLEQICFSLRVLAVENIDTG